MIEKNRFGAVLILAIVFAIGSLSGVGGTILYLKETREHRGERSSRTERSPRDIYRVQVDRMTERLEKSLQLSEEQVPLVRAEIVKFGNAMRVVHESMQPQFRSLMEERSIAIERHLNAEQQAAFQEERKKHWDRSKLDREGKRSEGSSVEPKSSSGPSACKQFTRGKKTC